MIPRVCLTILSLAAAALCLGRPLHAQEPPEPAGADSAKLGAVRSLLEVTGAAEVIVASLEANIPAQRAANPAVPAVFWDEFETLAKERIPSLVDSLVPIYDRHFTLDDVNELLAFYRTPVGQRLVEVQPLIARESSETGQRWGARLGVEVAAELAKRGIKFE